MNIYFYTAILILNLFCWLHASTIEVKGLIANNTTWDADTVKIVGHTDLADSATITIAPGSYVYMTNIAYNFKIMGLLIAAGTPSDTIVFSKGSLQFEQNSSRLDTSIIRYCRFEKCDYFGAIKIEMSTKLIIEHSLFVENEGSIKSGGCSPLIRNNVFRNNRGIPPTVIIESGSATIAENVFEENSSTLSGGVLSLINGNPLIVNNIFKNNTSQSQGGAIEIRGLSNPIFINNIFANNNIKASYGGALICHASISTIKIINCTFVNNSANSGGGAIFIGDSSNVDIINTIFWGNNAHIGSQIGTIYKDKHKLSLLNCVVDSGVYGISQTSFIYEECIEQNPQFLDTANYNFQVGPGSSCINNGGKDTTGLNLPEKDFGGNARIIDGRVDIGAYEYTGTFSIQDNFILKNETSFTAFGKNSQVAVYNMLGQKILCQSITHKQIIIDLEKHIHDLLGTGAHIFRIKNNRTNFAVQKIISIIK